MWPAVRWATSKSSAVSLANPTLVQVAYNPQVLLPASKLGENSEVLVQDIAKLAEPCESVSYWQLQVKHPL